MVHLKRKVTIKTKHAEEETKVSNQQVVENGNESKSSKKWLWAVIAVLVVVACVIGFMQLNPSAGNDETGGTEPVPADTAVAGKTDSVQTAPAASEADTASTSNEESAAEAENAKANEAEAAKANDATSAKAEETVSPSQAPSQVSESTTSSKSTGSVEDEARQVIRGIYGNGYVRKQNLGNRYAEIQGKVNEMYRNGQVH